jgi:hypothetical protein
METTSTNSSSPYQPLRTWGLVFSVGLTLVCLIAFICTCVESQPIYSEHYDVIRVDKVFNPVSLVYLFSCIPSLAFGSLFSAVARIGDDLRAVRASQGSNSEPTTNATPAKEDDNSTTLLIIAGVITVLAVVFIAVSGVLK